jgi:DNA-binding response OmpR family regulator
LIEAGFARRDNAALPFALRAAGFSGKIVLIAPEAPGKELDGTTSAWIARTLSPEMILRNLQRLLDRANDTFSLGPLTLHHTAEETTWRETLVALNRVEFNIVAALAERAGVTVPYRELYRILQHDLFARHGGDDRHRMLVRGAVERVRRKFLAHDAGFHALEHNTGLGYRWRFQADTTGATPGQFGRLTYN